MTPERLAILKDCINFDEETDLPPENEEFLRRVGAQREEILTAFIAKYGCGPDECEQVVQLSLDGEKYWVRLRGREK